MSKTVVLIPSDVLEQSHVAKIAGKYMPESLLASTPAEASGVLPLTETIYTVKKLRADATQHDAETFSAINADNNAFQLSRRFVETRNDAIRVVASAMARKNAIVKARAEHAAEKAA